MAPEVAQKESVQLEIDDRVSPVYAPPLPGKYELAAIGFVNKIREKFGAEPVYRLLKGTKGESSRCVIARSLQVGGRFDSAAMGGRAATVSAGGEAREFAANDDVVSFVGQFDSGKFPHLIEEE